MSHVPHFDSSYFDTFLIEGSDEYIMVEQNLLTIYKNKVSISCYSEFHAIAANLQFGQQFFSCLKIACNGMKL